MIIYDRSKNDLIIPTGFDRDCSEAYELGRSDGYQTGVVAGEQNIRGRIGRLYKNPHWDDIEGVVQHYTPSYPNSEGWNEVIIDYNNVHNDGLNEGYENGYNTGYDSGYTIGRKVKKIDIDGYSDEYYGYEWQGVWAVYEYGFNGRPTRTPTIAGGENKGDGVAYSYREWRTRYFGVDDILEPIDSITSIELRVGFFDDRLIPDPEDLNITINGNPIEIISSSKTLITEQGEGVIPRSIYRYNYNIRSITPSEYGEGFEDGYESGYTVGYEDGYSAERPTDSIVITNNGVYTNPSGGWSSIIANVHEETPEMLLEDKVIELDYSSPSGFSGDETYLPSEGYDGISSVEVKGLSAELYFDNINNTWLGATGGLNNAYEVSAMTLEITENGRYVASGTGIYEEGQRSCQFPLMFKDIRVNVPVSNICVSGTFTTDADTIFSPSDETNPYLVNMTPIDCLSNLKVDGVAMQVYCENSYMLPAGDHTFWMNYGMLTLTNGAPVTFTNYFPNAGIITYSRIHQE